MNRLEVIKAGMMSTVQDGGRFGMAHAGVSRSGPMDPMAFSVATALVGCAPGSAALEFAYVGGSFAVERPTRIAVTGGACDIRIDDRPVAAWESHWLKPGQTLHVGALRGAVWGYVAFSGGIEVPCFLGSRATHLRTGQGGFHGRALEAGDVLPLGGALAAPLLLLRLPIMRASGPIRVVAGPQNDYFDADAWKSFLSGQFRITDKRDRMATVLDGPPLRSSGGHDIVSDGAVPGAVQVPGSGRPIILGMEAQTTGGYPKIATVATVDLPRLFQLRTGSALRFSSISRDAAETLLIEHARRLSEALENLAVKSKDRV